MDQPIGNLLRRIIFHVLVACSNVKIFLRVKSIRQHGFHVECEKISSYRLFVYLRIHQDMAPQILSTSIDA